MPRTNKDYMRRRTRFVLVIIIAFVLILAAVTVLAAVYYSVCGCFDVAAKPLTNVTTVAGLKSEIGEPFGVAIKDGEVYVSDGMTNKIWRISPGQDRVQFAAGLNTPSAIAFHPSGDLIVADTGSHTIKKVDKNGVVSVLAGTEGEIGDADGPGYSAKFNAPVGVAVFEYGGIVVADTYNDKIKLIKDGIVTTLAGSSRGFADSSAASAKFDTPCGIATLKDGSILVADTMNSRIRLISPIGSRVSTIAGSGEADVHDGTLLDAAFYRPAAIAVGSDGSLFIADGNAIRTIRNRAIPVVETISKRERGFADGPLGATKFNRISAIAIDGSYDVLVTDSDNAAVRKITSQLTSKKGVPEYVVRTKRAEPAEFRQLQPGRWPFEPPETKRDIAGTLGEIRGEIVDADSQVWFHNGLDIAGGYGEKAYFIRDEKVLNPVAAENFGTLRELIRLPTLGYIHLRLGRDASNKSFGDDRFQFNGDMSGVRVPRGANFSAGDLIGTLNSMNHVHLIAGPSGDEMNALDALTLPGVSDKTPPVIEEVSFFNENWTLIETEPAKKRIKLAGKIRIVVRAFDRMDGNPERRRLGVFRLGYQVLRKDLSPMSDVNWNINFDRNPDSEAVKFAYAPGSKSGATGETIFNYIVTNKVSGNSFDEGFLDTAALGNGEFLLRVFAADYFGNMVSNDIFIEVTQ